MHADTSRPGVLLIGKSQVVVDEAVARLAEVGYDAWGTADFGPLAGRIELEGIDVLVLGRQVPRDRKAGLTDEVAAVNPEVIVVPSFRGIPGVIVNQVRGALHAELQDPRAPVYRQGDRAIVLTVAATCDAKVTALWQDSAVGPDPRSDSHVLLDERLRAGEHVVFVPERVPPEHAFAAVQIGEAFYTVSIADEP